MDINKMNEKNQNLKKANTSLNYFINENKKINTTVNQVNLNSSVFNNRNKSPFVPLKLPLKGRNSLRNSMIYRNFYFQNTEDILKHQKYNNSLKKRYSQPNTARFTMNNLRKSYNFIPNKNLSYSITENDDTDNNNDTIDLHLEIKVEDLVYLEKN